MTAPDRPAAPPDPTSRGADNSAAIVAMIAAVGTFSLGDMVMKMLGEALPTGQTLVTRATIALALVAIAARLRGETITLAQVRTPILWVRSACEMTLVALFVSSLPHMKLGDLTTITQSTPLMMTAMAALILKEPVGWRRWSATAVGFIGVAMVARPGANGLDPWALAAVAVAFLVAVRDMITRVVPPRVSIATITAMTTLAAGAGGVALAPFETWVAPSLQQMALTAAAAALTTIGNLFIIRAFRIGEASAVSPFRYAVIPFSLVWGFLAFGETPDGMAVAGIALIVGAGVYTLYRERKLARRATGR